MPRTRAVFRRLALLVTMTGLVAITGACGIPQVLSSSLPTSQGTISVGKTLSQPFLSPVNGLDGVTVAVQPPLGSDGELLPHPTGGATVAIRYAPQADNRFPEGAFHDWPATNQWLGELTGDRTIGQSFLSRYPGLNGITVRVATYGADTGTGNGTLKAGVSVTVRSLPIDGKEIATLPAGSTVMITGAAEGSAHVKLSDGRDGYIALDQFASLPPASRKNTHNVTLSLYRESDMSLVRQSTINASQMRDNSHITFTFEPIANSNNQHFRFVLSSHESTPGNAVTFRFDPTSSFADGQRFEGGRVVPGALVFRPTFAPGQPLYQGNIDSFAWSSLTNSFDDRFPAMSNTANRFLSVDLTPGTRTLNVEWSLARPAGGQPMVVDGNAQSPGGGLVFNVRYRENVSLLGIMSDSIHTVWRDVRTDPSFFGIYVIVLVGLISLGGVFGTRRWLDGR